MSIEELPVPDDGALPDRRDQSGGDGVREPILVVDDEPRILRSLKGLLDPEFVVHTASTGDEALKKLASEHVRAILTDQRMPGMSGVALLAQVRSHHPDVVRLLFTGYADIDAVIEAINHGHVFRYISKPWDPDQLIRVLYVACARHSYLAERRRLLDDLHRAQLQHLALFESLRQGQFGSLNQLGNREANRLDSNCRTLLESLARLLERGSDQSFE